MDEKQMLKRWAEILKKEEEDGDDDEKSATKHYV